MRCCGRAASVLFLVLLASPVHAAWHRLDSPNFVVIGDASERHLRDVAVKFEAFREVLGRLRGKELAIAPVPTVIIVFRSNRAFEPYRPRYEGKAVKVAGLFVPGPDVNHIAFVDDGEGWAARIMYHEYAHLVISNGAGRIPAWLNEGLAEVYSTFELTGDGRRSLIGRPIGEHLALLARERLLKLSELLEVDHSSPLYNEGHRRSVFYAQAWALVHMIRFGQPSRTNQLAAYLQRLAEGASAADAWKQAFGADPIDAELAHYVTRASYKAIQHEFSDKLSRFDSKARPLAPEEMHAFLAHFLMAQGRRDEAARQLASVPEAAEQHSLVLAVRAHGDAMAGDYAAVLQRLPAIERTDDWLASYYAGVAIAECARRANDKRPESVEAARRFFANADRERAFPNAVIRRASLELSTDSAPTDAIILAVQNARNAAPGRDDYAFVHAQLLALKSEFAAARSVLGPLMTIAREPATREAARSLMRWIVMVEQARRGAAPSAAPNESAQPAGAETTSSPADTSRTFAVFRKTGDEEERLDGMLQSIDCGKDGSAVLVLQASDKTVRLPARRMDQVDFITYRDDLAGTVSCGALERPLRVYVTSRRAPSADAAANVVAVEFLPKDMQ